LVARTQLCKAVTQLHGWRACLPAPAACRHSVAGSCCWHPAQPPVANASRAIPAGLRTSVSQQVPRAQGLPRPLQVPHPGPRRGQPHRAPAWVFLVHWGGGLPADPRLLSAQSALLPGYRRGAAGCGAVGPGTHRGLQCIRASIFRPSRSHRVIDRATDRVGQTDNSVTQTERLH
jgi:hypothetical protein